MARFLNSSTHLHEYLGSAVDHNPRPASGRAPNYLSRNFISGDVGNNLEFWAITCKGGLPPQRNTVPANTVDLENSIDGWEPFANLPDVERKTAKALAIEDIEKDTVRVIFCPFEYGPQYMRWQLDELRWLMDQFNMPTMFLMEKVRSVTHSFGVQKGRSGSYDYWYRFLGNNPIFNGMKLAGYPSWKKFSIFSQWHEHSNAVTIFCFGGEHDLILQTREFLSEQENVESLITDPYVFLIHVLGYIFPPMDTLVWNTLDHFRDFFEKEVFEHNKSSFRSVVDFAELHYIANHIMHFLEGVDATLDAIEMITKQHRYLERQCKNVNYSIVDKAELNVEVERGFDYLRGLFMGQKLRLRSLETRVKNVIGLTFHLVTADDSSLVQRDSASLRVLSILTFVFLPATAIASMFQTPFLNYDPEKRDDANGGMSLSPKYWIFPVIAVPIILITVLIWLWQEKLAFEKLKKRKTKKLENMRNNTVLFQNSVEMS